MGYTLLLMASLGILQAGRCSSCSSQQTDVHHPQGGEQEQEQAFDLPCY